ncbi:hypothetical protein J6590_049016 [Homalodisca vitripennis]|nr:hypothetical protein J6590_049016 [Homalodisca vitripennis]
MNTSTLLILALGCVVAAEQTEISKEEYKRIIVECRKEAGFGEKELDMAELGRNGTEKIDLREKYKCTISCVLRTLKVVDDSGEMDTKMSSDVVDSLMKNHSPEAVLRAKTLLIECAEKRFRFSGRKMFHYQLVK